MHEQTRNQLLAINRQFYSNFAEPFALSRANPQPGFERLLSHVPGGCTSILDVGCGEGRFGRFLQAHRPGMCYVGVDLSEALLERARESIDGARVYRRDISQVGSLTDLGRYCFVVCLAVLQHVPGREQRVRLLGEMGQRLMPAGRLAVSTWQFLESERQRNKVVDWGVAGVAANEVEEGDYLLSWRSGGYALRYVAFIDRQEMAGMAQDAGLRVVDSYRSDGLEGDLNLYTVLQTDDGSSRSS